MERRRWSLRRKKGIDTRAASPKSFGPKAMGSKVVVSRNIRHIDWDSGIDTYNSVFIILLPQPACIIDIAASVGLVLVWMAQFPSLSLSSRGLLPMESAGLVYSPDFRNVLQRSSPATLTTTHGTSETPPQVASVSPSLPIPFPAPDVSVPPAPSPPLPRS